MGTENDPVGGGGVPGTNDGIQPGQPKESAGGGAWTPDSLPEEAKAWLKQQLSTESAKLRVGSKEAAAKAARDEVMSTLSNALGLGAPEQDPAKLAESLKAAQREARELRIERAIERACAKVGVDADLTEALLTKRGKLAGVDLTAATFADDIAALVAEAAETNPRLRLEAAAPPPAAAGATDVQGFTGAGNQQDITDVSSMDVGQMMEYLRKHR